MNIGDRIKQRRIDIGLTADELADKIGKSRATIYRYENGDIENFPTPILEPLARALRTTPAALMGWGEIEKEPEHDYKLFMSMFERQDIKFSYVGISSPIDNKNEPEFYVLITPDETCYKISVPEYHALKRDIDNFVKFKLSEHIDEYHKIKPINKTKKENPISTTDINPGYVDDNQHYLEVQAAHERTDIEVTDEMRKHDDDIMDDENFWK